MILRIRFAIGLALSLTLITSITVFAKGGFSFITVTGKDLKDAVRLTDPALTEDFFAFADFFQDKAKEPANPGAGYEITRYYIDGKRDVAFDRLHYYPGTSFVYYDGIVNGSSEYDGEWYTAKPEIKTVFENVLLKQTQLAAPIAQPQPVISVDPTQTGKSVAPSQSVILIAVTAGTAFILAFAFRLRRSRAH